MRILAHLDLDAFYAAVEELEDPRCDAAARRRRRPARPRRRLDRELRRAPLRDPLGDERRRGATALSRTPSSSGRGMRLYRQYSRGSGPRSRGRAAGRADRDRRGLPRPCERDRRRLRRARAALAEAVQTAVRGATRLSCSLGVSTAKVVCKVASERRKPGGITVVPPGSEARFLAPYPVRALPGVGPRAEARLTRRAVETIGALAALSDADLRAVLPGSVGRLLRDRARGIDQRDLELDGEQVSISVEETFARDLTDREALHAELRRMSVEVGGHLRRRGLAARTVTAKLRYADFSIRSARRRCRPRSTTTSTIAELACALLDRGLRDRPGRAAAGRRRRLGPLRLPPAHARRLRGLAAEQRPGETGRAAATLPGDLVAAVGGHLDARLLEAPPRLVVPLEGDHVPRSEGEHVRAPSPRTPRPAPRRSRCRAPPAVRAGAPVRDAGRRAPGPARRGRGVTSGA